MSSSLGFTRIARIRSSRPDTKKRVDFIMELPLEIVVCYILPKVLSVFCNLPELSPCFQVCRAWNERMIPRVGNIRFFMLRNDHAWSVEDWMQVDAFTPHIKTLVINGSTPSVIWPLAERLRFPSLCDLTLQGKDDQCYPHTHMSPLIMLSYSYTITIIHSATGY